MAYRVSRVEAVALAWMAVGLGRMAVWQASVSDWVIPLVAMMVVAALGVGFFHYRGLDSLVWVSLPGWALMGWAIGPPLGVREVLMPVASLVLLSGGALVRGPRSAKIRIGASAALLALLGMGPVLGAGTPWAMLALLGVPRWVRSERARLRDERPPQTSEAARRLWVEWAVVTLGGLVVGYWISVIAR